MSTTRKFAFAALFVVAAAFVWAQLRVEPLSDDPERTAAASTPNEPDEPVVVAADFPVLRAAPDLTDLDGWLQTESTTLDDFEGRVVVLQFWTFSCRNCKATIPNLQEIYSTYDRDQLQIVGVHAPEFGFEEDPEAVLGAAADLGVTWPIALDTSKRNFHSWQEGRTAYWPRTYVIDAEGNIRFDHIGEGRYDELQDAVAALIAEL